jgi:demethylmenaquinone methyltransferase/2-methoxy-6-polyprenyl-1,4-benzoquinol methylase
VLEIGCGTGRNFPYILDRIGPTGQLVAVDSCIEMLRAAKGACEAHGWDNVTLIQGDATVVAINEEEGFDGALSVLALNGLPNYLSLIRRAHAVLRPGGRYVACDLQPFTGWARALNPALRLLGPLLGWRAHLQIPADVNSIFGNVDITTYAAGSMFIAAATRGADLAPVPCPTEVRPR